VGSLEAQLPQYQARERQAMNALAILLGKPPGALDANSGMCSHCRSCLRWSTGIPSTLARRPDIREAEASLHAATAQIGVSVAQLFPSLTLSGQFGLRNSETTGSPTGAAISTVSARRFLSLSFRAGGWSPA
jgi:outer membrane protein TolC